MLVKVYLDGELRSIGSTAAGTIEMPLHVDDGGTHSITVTWEPDEPPRSGPPAPPPRPAPLPSPVEPGSRRIG